MEHDLEKLLNGTGSPDDEPTLPAEPEQEAEPPRDDGEADVAAADEAGDDGATGDDEAAPPAAETQEPQPSTVPMATLLREREERQRLAAQLQQMQNMLLQQQGQQPNPPAQSQQPELPPIPDVFEDPAAAFQTLEERIATRFDQRLQAMQEAQQAERVNASVLSARERYPDFDQVVQAYLPALQARDPQIVDRLSRAPDPGEATYQLVQRARGFDEIGNDPNAYRERVRQELLQEMQQGGGGMPGGQRAPAPAAPRSLARQTSVAGRNAGVAPSAGIETDLSALLK